MYEHRITVWNIPTNVLYPLMLSLGDRLLEAQETALRRALMALRIPRLHAEVHWFSWRLERDDDSARLTAILQVRNLVQGPRPLP